MKRPRRRWLAAAAALTAGAAILPGASAAAWPQSPAAGPAASAAASPTAVPPRYTQQQIDWQPCFPDGAPEGFPAGSERLECGVFLTPRDWKAPGQRVDLQIAVTRLRPASGDAGRSVLTNPGGPGGPGLTLPLVFLAAERTRLTDSREIVGIDVRGTGSSTNVTCAGGTDIGAQLDPRDRSRPNARLILDSVELAARFCQTLSADLTKVITTEQTVRDLDLLRTLLGRTSIDWVGYSGGTWLGAAYATYFPGRVGRFVLDANTEFTTTWQRSFAWQPLGFERRWRQDFLPWAARYDERFGLGSTPAQVRAAYEELRATLAEEPLSLGSFDVGPTLLDTIVIQSLYSKDAFSDLADTIAVFRALVSGELSPAQAGVSAPHVLALLQRATEQPASLQPLAADAFPATFLHITCNDTPWQGDRAWLLRTSAEQAQRYPLLGWYTLAQPCVFWDRTGVPTLAPRTGQGVPPVLMVQNDKDPATPIEGARRAREAFTGARLLTVVDEGDHGIYPFNPCVNRKVEAFLIDGARPTDSTCRGLGLPEPLPPFDPGQRVAAGPAGTPLEFARWYAREADLLGG